MGAALAWKCRACGHVLAAGMRPAACFRCGALNGHTAHDGPPPRARRAAPLAGGAEAPSSAEPLPWAPDMPEASAGAPAGLAWASDTTPEVVERARCGWAPWASVTGELARRRVALLAGPRGAGKTRTIARVAYGIAALEGRAVVIATGEQSAGDLAAILALVAGGQPLGPVAILPTRRLEDAIAAASSVEAIALFVDGFQTFTLGGEPCRGGSRTIAQGVDTLAAWARGADGAVCIAPHMTTTGEQIGGGAILQQLCDTIVRLAPLQPADDAPDTEPARVRLFVDGKNRHGPVNIRRTLQWTARGTLEGGT